MKYRFMDLHRHEFSIALTARVLNVSRSGFYDWCQPRGPSVRAIAREILDERVKAVFEAHKGRYGAPRVTAELRELGHGYD